MIKYIEITYLKGSHLFINIFYTIVLYYSIIYHSQNRKEKKSLDTKWLHHAYVYFL